MKGNVAHKPVWQVRALGVDAMRRHTIPYLIPAFYTATSLAAVVVVFELLAIAWIQWRSMDTRPVSAAAKVMLGGGLMLATGILIGQAG